MPTFVSLIRKQQIFIFENCYTFWSNRYFLETERYPRLDYLLVIESNYHRYHVVSIFFSDNLEKVFSNQNYILRSYKKPLDLISNDAVEKDRSFLLARMISFDDKYGNIEKSFFLSLSHSLFSFSPSVSLQSCLSSTFDDIVTSYNSFSLSMCRQ